MVRFGDYLYIKNNFPNQRTLSVEALKWPAGEELWEKYDAKQLNAQQQQVVRKKCPPEELFQVSKDVHQLNNLVNDNQHKVALEKARNLLKEWSRQTGDSVPQNPTPDRDGRPGTKTDREYWEKVKYKDLPGQSNKATQINHPGPQ